LACVLWLAWVFCIETGGINNLSQSSNASNQIQWQAYSPASVDTARQQGEPVFIDFTAAWCINCQVNDRLVLQNSQVVQAFKQRGVVAFKADWTKYDAVITKALSLYGRDSIPVYVYYAPGSDTPVILPQVITPQIVLEKIK
jgi:thiol:disulfide interchange protein